MRLALAALALSACKPAPVAEPAPAPVEDAPDAAPPDAGPSAAVLAAPPWVFRYRASGRDETWTLRHADGEAQMIVHTPQGDTVYLGAAIDGDSLALSLASPTAKIALDCKPASRPYSATCNDTTSAPIDVLDCYHPDFAAPMPFAAAPGIEYVVDATCNGYRLVGE